MYRGGHDTSNRSSDTLNWASVRGDTTVGGETLWEKKHDLQDCGGRKHFIKVHKLIMVDSISNLFLDICETWAKEQKTEEEKKVKFQNKQESNLIIVDNINNLVLDI